MSMVRDAQWQVAETWVSGAVKEAGITSGDKYYSWLRDQGQIVSRDVARNVWSEYGVETRWADVIARLPEGQAIPRAWYSETNSEYIKGYGYKSTVQYTDAITGESTETPYFIASANRMTNSEQAALIKSHFEEGTGDIKGTVTQVAFGAHYHKAGAKW